jgi:glycerol-3-phosphate dehydrogenase (NAD(P)+)
MKLALLGAGAWGTALAIVLARAHDVVLWTRNAEFVKNLRDTRMNARYLPGYPLPSEIRIEDSLSRAIAAVDVIIAVVPTASLREVTKQITRENSAVPIVIASKGFETGTGKLPYEVCAETLSPDSMIGVLSGPSFAQEVAKGLPAALTLAAFNENFAIDTARELNSSRLRVYSSTDVIGVALGGGLKNVMAIAAGISDGMGLGANARAALITRGLAEMARLGQKLGGQAETFMGLTGLGDLVLTATGDLSRNRQVGLQLAQGESLQAILQRLGHVAEGVYSAREAAARAIALKVDMPITQAVCDVIDGKLSPREALERLLSREPKPEANTGAAAGEHL